MNGVQIEKVGKVGKAQNSKTDEERKDQNEETLCKSITKGLARCNREKACDLGSPAKNCCGMKCSQLVNKN